MWRVAQDSGKIATIVFLCFLSVLFFFTSGARAGEGAKGPQDKAQAYKQCVLSSGCDEKDKSCAETLGLTPQELARGKLLVDDAYRQDKICTYYDASLYPDCWGGTSCAADSPYLFKLNGGVLLALLLAFSASLLAVIGRVKSPACAVSAAIVTVLLTLYVNGGGGQFEYFMQAHFDIAARQTGRALVHLDLAMMLGCLFSGFAGALLFTFARKDPRAFKLSLAVFGISLLNVAIEFLVAAASA